MSGPIIRILSPVVGAAERVLVLKDTPIRLGRDADNDVVLLEQAASRHHARIEPVADGYEIVDLGSASGLRFGERRVGRHRFRDGDEITLGATTLRFVGSATSEPTVIPPQESGDRNAVPAARTHPANGARKPAIGARDARGDPTGGYSLRTDDRGPLAAVDLDTALEPRSPRQSRSGFGLHLALAGLGAATAFGVLVAAFGTPW